MTDEQQQETTTEEAKPEEEAKDEGVEESSSTPVIDQAKEAAKLMKAENDRKEKLLQREEKLQATNVLGGKSDAGEREKSKELSDIDYAQAVLEGKINPLEVDTRIENGKS